MQIGRSIQRGACNAVRVLKVTQKALFLEIGGTQRRTHTVGLIALQIIDIS